MRALDWTKVLLLLVLSGCTDSIPTWDDGDRIPVQAETVEVRLPWESFARDYSAFSGFESPADLGELTIAHEWAGELESRVLFRFGPLPAAIQVFPPGATTGAVSDSLYHPVSGKVILRLDSLGLGNRAFDFEAEAIQTPWHAPTANWEFAADTAGVPVPWPEPGGGPVRALISRTWSPVVADTFVLAIDSLTVTEWADAELADRGLLLRSTTADAWIPVLGANLRVMARSSVNPDTLVELSAPPSAATMIYTPVPETSEGVIQIGGVPASRAVFRLELPATVDPGPLACATMACPLDLTGEGLLLAAVEFHTHPTLSPGFAPLDSLGIQIRPVLTPSRLPRSPLGSSVQGGAGILPPELFSAETETRYEIPLTNYVRGLLTPDSTGVRAPPPTLAIMSAPEPSGLEVMSFYGPGTPLEPYLRLILTVTDGVSLP